MSLWVRLFGKKSTAPVQQSVTAPLPKPIVPRPPEGRSTVPTARAAPLREYATAYIFQPPQSAKRAYDALQAAIDNGKEFPLAAPYQVALVHGRFADFIAVLARLQTVDDESVSFNRQIEAWFVDAGVGAFDDYEALSDNRPGNISPGLAYLPDKYTVLELIDKLPPSNASTTASTKPETIDDSSAIRKCKRCDTVLLTKPQFISTLAQSGITVNPHNLDDYKASGRGIGSYESVMNNIRTTYDNLQKRRAFACRSCGSTYCMECLLKYAPSSASGGKACPQCKGAFAEA
jgi:hypothetical protein